MAEYTQLTLSDRCKLHFELMKKEPIKLLAEKMGRHRSTIYRERKRNKSHDTYDPSTANKLAKERRAGGAKPKIESHPELQEYVIAKLNLHWSPEEISGRIKQENKKFSVCTETIYQFVYRDPEKSLYKFLPTQIKKRAHRHQRKKYNHAVKKAIIEAHNIKHRPIEVASREHIHSVYL